MSDVCKNASFLSVCCWVFFVSCHGLNLHRYYKFYCVLLPARMVAKATVATCNYCFIVSRVSCSQIILIRGVNYTLLWCLCLNIVVKKHLIKLHVYFNFFWSLWLNIVIKYVSKLCLPPASSRFLAWCIFEPWRERWYVPVKHQLTFMRLHSVMPQRTELFKIFSFLLRTRH